MATPDHSAFAESALEAYDLPREVRPKLISLSENATFLVDADEPLGVLRVYRPGYQSIGAMQSELAWISALRKSGTVLTPAVIATRNGEQLHEVEVDGHSRACAMFEFIEGEELGDDDLHTFSVVGRIAATLHNQVIAWERPTAFERFVWDTEAILGANARWGDWRNGPRHTTEGKDLLEEADRRVRDNLARYPLGPRTSGLVHCDLRAANLLAGRDGELWVIDFDDCGFSWFLWDLCSTTTLIEHLPHVDDVVSAWLDGYGKERQLGPDDLDVIPDLVFLRRLHILAWLGTHPESDLAKELGDTYAAETYAIARRYLDGEFLASVRTRRGS